MTTTLLATVIDIVPDITMEKSYWCRLFRLRIFEKFSDCIMELDEVNDLQNMSVLTKRKTCCES